MTELLDRVEDGLPFRHDLAGNERLEAGNQRGKSLPGGKADLVLGRDPGELLSVLRRRTYQEGPSAAVRPGERGLTRH
jgi:hypothetical protein